MSGPSNQAKDPRFTVVTEAADRLASAIDDLDGTIRLMVEGPAPSDGGAVKMDEKPQSLAAMLETMPARLDGLGGIVKVMNQRLLESVL